MRSFGLIVQPRSLNDARRRVPALRVMPPGLASRVLRFAPPLFWRWVGTVRSAHGRAAGFLVWYPLPAVGVEGLPDQVIRRKLSAAVRLACRAGASVVGLCCPASTRWDSRLSPSPPVPVTSGISYALCAALDCLGQLAMARGIDLWRAEVVVLDAASRVGAVFAELLSGEVRYLTLVDQNRRAMRVLAGRLLSTSGTAVRVIQDPAQVLGRADIAIVCGETTPGPGSLKPAALLYHAWPWGSRGDEGTAEGVAEATEIVVRVPAEGDVNVGFPYPAGTMPAYMVEPILIALGEEELLRHGEFTCSRVRASGRAARKHGFVPVAVRASGQVWEWGFGGRGAPENC